MLNEVSCAATVRALPWADKQEREEGGKGNSNMWQSVDEYTHRQHCFVSPAIDADVASQ